MVPNQAIYLPPLRNDLQLWKASDSYDGSPTWTLYDPLTHRFFRIGDLIYQMLSRWKVHEGHRLIESMTNETVFKPNQEDVMTLIQFLQANQLTVQSNCQKAQNYISQYKKNNSHQWLKLINHYLFFRIPLFRPDHFLNRTYPIIRKLFSTPFLILALLIAITGFYLVSRQWDNFTHTFLYFFTFQGFLVYTVAIVFVKIVHELGHAYTAKHYGCRVSSMGVAFMVMIPMLYTDMSDTWRLSNRKQRVHIAAAGIINEWLLAGFCLWLWAFFPEGALKSACFVMATTSLFSSLVINMMPFMRFDGYFILADVWGIENLQERSFQLARWKLRQWLFGPIEDKPEYLSGSLEARLVIYAWLTWLYRLLLFLGIAILVYHLFFKVLGILLFVVEVIMLILMPIFREMKHWWRLKESIQQKGQPWRPSLLILVLIGLLLIPWSSSIYVPGVLTSANYATLFATESAQVVSIHVKQGQLVEKGQVLINFKSPKLEKDIDLSRKQLELLEIRAMRAVSYQQDQEELPVIREQIATELVRLAGLEKKQAQLTLRAPFSGVVAEMDEDLHYGQWVNQGKELCLILDPIAPEIKGVIPEKVLRRIEIGQQAIFYPENWEYPKLTAEINRIDWGNVHYLDLPYLASKYGGSIAVKNNGELLVPAISSYALYLNNIPFAVPQQEIRGHVLIKGKPVSLINSIFEQVISVLIRESGY